MHRHLDASRMYWGVASAWGRTLDETRKEKAPTEISWGFNIGGAGGDRTRVRKYSTISSTYLVQSFDLTVLSRTNTLRNSDPLDFRLRRRGTTEDYLT